MPRFEPGDKVIGNDKAARYGVTTTGWEGTVRNTWTANTGIEYIEVRGPDRDGRPLTFTVMADSFDPETPPFDCQKPVRTRSGQPVKLSVGFDQDRPFEATVQVGDREFILTYDAHGRFCPHGKSPVDLING